MLSLNINKLRSDVEEREKKKKKIFENILEMCYQKILNTNKKSDDYNCTFVVPNVVFGLPLYNVGDCITFIMDRLVEKGFEIYFALPTTIHISWKPTDYNQNIYNTNSNHSNQSNQLEYYNTLQNQNKLIVKYNGSNTGLNDKLYKKENKFQNNNTSTQLKNSNYKPIEEYKEYSNTIYDLDELDLFQNKVNNLF
jgi:hypothetical protein